MGILGHVSILLFILVICTIYFIMFVITEDYDSFFRMMIHNREDYCPLLMRDFWTIFILSGIIFIIIELFYWITVLFCNNINL